MTSIPESGIAISKFFWNITLKIYMKCNKASTSVTYEHQSWNYFIASLTSSFSDYPNQYWWGKRTLECRKKLKTYKKHNRKSEKTDNQHQNISLYLFSRIQFTACLWALWQPVKDIGWKIFSRTEEHRLRPRRSDIISTTNHPPGPYSLPRPLISVPLPDAVSQPLMVI